MLSSSTCVTPPIALSDSRLIRRMRLENSFTTSAMPGATTSVTSVSFQLSQSSHASSSVTVSVSRTSVVSTLVAAPVTPVTS